ncbi:MAG: hypothetical protein M1824_003014 [Vezdaea acicularis]|nr:MAG: hypothetical protein M1824_003014 [Vezdaea acicularis]
MFSPKLFVAVVAAFAILGSAQTPPANIISELLVVVPPTDLANLQNTAGQLSLYSAYEAGNPPSWFNNLPADAKAFFVSAFDSVSSAQAATATPAPTPSAGSVTPTTTPASSSPPASTTPTSSAVSRQTSVIDGQPPASSTPSISSSVVVPPKSNFTANGTATVSLFSGPAAKPTGALMAGAAGIAGVLVLALGL